MRFNITCINIRHMQPPYLFTTLAPSAFFRMGKYLAGVCSLIAGASAPFTPSLSIFLSFYPLSAPPEGGKRLTASQQGRYVVGEVSFRVENKVTGAGERGIVPVAYGENYDIFSRSSYCSFRLTFFPFLFIM